MAKEFFRNVRFRDKSKVLIAQCNAIIAAYQAAGLRLTLRQLYYQLVTKNIIVNSEKSYKALSSLVSDARLAGLMDWDAIEDRVRVPKMSNEYANLEELTEAALYSYRLPRWRDQDCYVELWVEKDALAGVLSPIARKYHIALMVNRGYSSQSAMYESAKRFISRADGRDMHLLYLGDHDPSGEDMVRDIRERLAMFEADVEVTKVALTMTQVKKHKPPPNPAKITDPRAEAYIKKFGPHSWEVDALDPATLKVIIESSLDGLTDWDRMNAIIDEEEEHKTKLREVVAGL